MSRRSYYDDYYYAPSVPREAKGGIKAQAQRGAFGQSWWAKRWLAVLESFNLGARLTRGRSYARSGQVLNIDVEKGLVKADVQGSRPKPYHVTIRVKTLSDAEWEKVAEALSGQALFAAKLLAGEMPQDIEEAFRGAGLSLFPDKVKDLDTDCSCPDWSNPCKHIAAVYYLLGEEFDRDPFLLFRLRGRTREEILGRLADLGGPGPAAGAEEAPPLPPEPLPTALPDFWAGQPLPDDLFGEVRTPPVNAALLKRLGGFPFWRAATPLIDALAPVYAQSGSRGLEVFLGDDQRDDGER